MSSLEIHNPQPLPRRPLRASAGPTRAKGTQHACGATTRLAVNCCIDHVVRHTRARRPARCAVSALLATVRRAESP